MRENFHEAFDHGDIKPPSERSTGFVFTVVAAVVAIWWRNVPITPWVALGIAGVLVVLSLAAPRLLRPLTMLWFRIGLLLHRVVNPLVMLVIFVLVFVPAGLIMRIWHDPLRSRRAELGSTYWLEHSQSPGAMTNQF